LDRPPPEPPDLTGVSWSFQPFRAPPFLYLDDPPDSTLLWRLLGLYFDRPPPEPPDLTSVPWTLQPFRAPPVLYLDDPPDIVGALLLLQPFRAPPTCYLDHPPDFTSSWSSLPPYLDLPPPEPPDLPFVYLLLRLESWAYGTCYRVFLLFGLDLCRNRYMFYRLLQVDALLVILLLPKKMDESSLLMLSHYEMLDIHEHAFFHNWDLGHHMLRRCTSHAMFDLLVLTMYAYLLWLCCMLLFLLIYDLSHVPFIWIHIVLITSS